MKQITAAETPLQLVEKYRRKYSFKDTYDAMDEAKDKLVEAFPECFCDWCQMPIAVPTNLLATAGYTPIECVRDGASLSACYLWRQYKIIYDFARGRWQRSWHNRRSICLHWTPYRCSF